MSVKSLIRRSGHVVDIEARSTTRTAAGGRVPGYTASAQEVACWIQPANSELREAYAQRQVVLTHVVYFGEKPNIAEGSRLKWGDKYLIAVSGAEDQAGVGKVWRVLAQEGR